MGISVLISVYTKENSVFLDKALESIWDYQTLKPNQIVLIKDGELTSELEVIIKKWAVRIDTSLKIIELNQNLSNYEFDDKSRNLQIYGWAVLKNKNLSVESTYIFIDDKVHSKAVYGFLRKDLETYGLEERSFFGWQGIIDPKKISFGCHDVSIRVVSGNEYSEIYLYVETGEFLKQKKYLSSSNKYQ